MEILWLLCKSTGLVALTLFLFAIIYAVVSTLLQNILRDFLRLKKYIELKQENEKLVEKIEKLEIELIDKTEK